MSQQKGILWVNGEPYPIQSADVSQGPGGYGLRLEVSLAKALEPQQLGDAQVSELRLLLIELDLQAGADLASEIGRVIAQELRNHH